MLEAIFTFYILMGGFAALAIATGALIAKNRVYSIRDPYFYVFIALAACPFVNLVVLGMFIEDILKYSIHRCGGVQTG